MSAGLSKGIAVVEARIEQNHLVMPYIREKTAQSFLKDLLTSDREAFIQQSIHLHMFPAGPFQHLPDLVPVVTPSLKFCSDSRRHPAVILYSIIIASP